MPPVPPYAGPPWWLGAYGAAAPQVVNLVCETTFAVEDGVVKSVHAARECMRLMRKGCGAVTLDASHLGFCHKAGERSYIWPQTLQAA